MMWRWLVVARVCCGVLVQQKQARLGLYYAARTSEETGRRVRNRVEGRDALGRLNSQDYAVEAGSAVCITGATSGIGLELGLLLTRLGYDVVFCGRSAAKLEKAKRSAESLRGAGSSVKTAQFDLNSLESTARGAEEVRLILGDQKLGAVVLNAGSWPTILETTIDDFESGLQTNYLSQALFVDRLALGKPASVLCVSSIAHAFCDDLEFLLKDPSYEKSAFDSTKSYAATKLMNILYAKELGRRHAHLRTLAAHPGFIADTNLWRSFDFVASLEARVPDPLGLFATPFYQAQSLATTAETFARAALDLLKGFDTVSPLPSPLKTPVDAARDLAAALLDPTLNHGNYASDGELTETVPIADDPQLSHRLFDWTTRIFADRGFTLLSAASSQEEEKEGGKAATTTQDPRQDSEAPPLEEENKKLSGGDDDDDSNNNNDDDDQGGGTSPPRL